MNFNETSKTEYWAMTEQRKCFSFVLCKIRPDQASCLVDSDHGDSWWSLFSYILLTHQGPLGLIGLLSRWVGAQWNLLFAVSAIRLTGFVNNIDPEEFCRRVRTSPALCAFCMRWMELHLELLELVCESGKVCWVAGVIKTTLCTSRTLFDTLCL